MKRVKKICRAGNVEVNDFHQGTIVINECGTS